MKNILLFSSILAAGTLAVNAATVLSIPTGQATQKSLTVTDVTHSSISDSIIGSILGYGAGIFGGGNNNWISDSDWTNGHDGTVVGDIENGYSITMLGRTGVAGEWFASVFDVTGLGYKEYTLKAVYPASLITSYTVAIIGTYLDESSSVKYCSEISGINGDVGLQSLSLSLDDSVELTSVAFFIKGSAAEAKSTYTIFDVEFSAVPEPSVFGLFAGIVALALAGTRRRRRVK